MEMEDAGLVLDDATQFVVVLKLLVQVLCLLFVHLILLIGDIRRVEKVEEGIRRLLDIEGAHFALLLLLLLHDLDSDIFSFFPLNICANGLLQAFILIIRVQQVRLSVRGGASSQAATWNFKRAGKSGVPW